MSRPTDARMKADLTGLHAFLSSRPQSQSRIGVALIVIEQLLGRPLPPQARSRSWWTNDPSVAHSRAWLDAGWRVEEMNPRGGVGFVRATA